MNGWIDGWMDGWMNGWISVFPKARQTRNLRVQILKTEAAPLIKKGHARN